jgi:alkylation response protein AidB-like acyl-CoA dehydrogenase
MQAEQLGDEMDWSDSEEQARFRGEVRDFIQARLPEYYRRVAEQGGPVIRDYIWQQDRAHGNDEAKAAALEWEQAVRERGWIAPHWPAEYGGAGMTVMEHFILNQEFSAAEAPVVGGQGVSMLGPTLIVHGTEEQKQRFLPAVLSSEMIWAQGYSEPGAGSDLASLQTRAVRDGDEYVVNGQKIWTTNAHRSNWIFALVRTDQEAPKHRGISFMLFDLDTPGISVRPLISGGWRHFSNETFYEDVRVPADQIVGEENRGWYVGMTLLDYERSSIGGAVANRRDLRRLVDELSMAELPGPALLSPTVRSEIADRVVESEVGFNFSLRIVSMQASGLVPNYEASMGKMFLTELMQRIARTGTRALGLYANIWDEDDPNAPLHAYFTHRYVSTVPWTIGGGTSEIQRNIIATRGLGLPRG